MGRVIGLFFVHTALLLSSIASHVAAWQQWAGTPPTYERNGTGYHDWEHGVPNPDGRRGHTLTYFGKYAVLFGGRGTDTTKFHPA